MAERKKWVKDKPDPLSLPPPHEPRQVSQATLGVLSFLVLRWPLGGSLGSGGGGGGVEGRCRTLHVLNFHVLAKVTYIFVMLHVLGRSGGSNPGHDADKRV